MKECHTIGERPLVSFVILTYNQENYVKDTLDGALSQDYSNVEIVISDDASLDNTFENILNYLREHPTDKKVYTNRNKTNLGLVPHFNYVMHNLVHGEVIVLAGGDDVSLPNRVADSMEVFETNPSAIAVTGQAIIIDGKGNITGEFNCVDKGAYSLNDDYIQTTSFMCGGTGPAYRKKEVWDLFGALHPSCPTEDSTLRLRALLCGQMIILDKMFIKYRIHGNNMSLGQNMYKLKSKAIADQYLRDLKIASKLSLQSRDTLKRLCKKARLYYYNRQLSYMMSVVGNRYMKYPFNMLQKVIRKIVKTI